MTTPTTITPILTPDELDEDLIEIECAGDDCENLVGFVYTVTEDTYGNEREGYTWVDPYSITDADNVELGIVCEDCAP